MQEKCCSYVHACLLTDPGLRFHISGNFKSCKYKKKYAFIIHGCFFTDPDICVHISSDKNCIK